MIMASIGLACEVVAEGERTPPLGFDEVVGPLFGLEEEEVDPRLAPPVPEGFLKVEVAFLEPDGNGAPEGCFEEMVVENCGLPCACEGN